jgi:glycosyltransferase involved in cell wall biosynthesis
MTRATSGDTPATPRIAMVVEAAGGGVAVHLADLIAGLRRRTPAGVHLIAPSSDRFDAAILSDAMPHCASFHRLPFRREVGMHDASAAVQLYRLLRRLRPDVVHSHSSKAGALARICRGPWKQVYTPHAVYTLNPTLSPAKRRFYGGIERLLGNGCSDAVIAVSNDEAEHLRGLGVARTRVRTIANGVTAPPLLLRTTARTVLGLSMHAFVVGFVGRFDHQKGVDRLVRVARQLQERYGDRLQVAAIGSGDFCQAAGMEAGQMPGNLRVLGRIDDARRYFSAFDVLALPSRYEGFPYVCLEALAAHVPFVATRVAGASELAMGYRVGLMVSNDDGMAEFVQAVASLVEQPDRIDGMRTQCSQVSEYFTADAMVDRTFSVYRDVLAGDAP